MFMWGGGNAHDVAIVMTAEGHNGSFSGGSSPVKSSPKNFSIRSVLTQYRLAKDTIVPARRINEVVKGERSIGADTARRFVRGWIGASPAVEIQIRRTIGGLY
jgi:hypothetical protein